MLIFSGIWGGVAAVAAFQHDKVGAMYSLGIAMAFLIGSEIVRAIRASKHP